MSALLVGLALSLAGAAAGDAEGWSLAGTLVLLATPAAGLLATAFELRRAQPRAALLALVVLGVLGLAVLVTVA